MIDMQSRKRKLSDEISVKSTMESVTGDQLDPQALDSSSDLEASKTQTQIPSTNVPLRCPASTPSTSNPAKAPCQCQYYLPKKKRTCKANAAPEKLFCVEHSFVASDEGETRRRIPCPLDPKHSCYEDKLQKHLKKCNKTKETQTDYYSRGINSGDADGCITEDYKVTIRSVPDEEVLTMVAVCKKLYTERIGSLPREQLFHPVVKEAFEDPKNGGPAKKHLSQQASLVAHMEKNNLLFEKSTFIEFGAGKGALSHWVQQALKTAVDTQYILVEKSGYRYKMDNLHKGEDQGPSFERLKIDIEHLDLGKCPNLDHDRSVIGMGKHLCGSATDLMIRCMLETLQPKQDCERKATGVVLALCCHHRCDWKSYVGKAFMKSCGLNARQFMLLCSLSSWGTCAAAEVSEDNDYHHPRYGKLLPQEREQIGHMCKNLVDYGRAQYLKDKGFDVKLLQYVGKDLTLENVCLIAKRK